MDEVFLRTLHNNDLENTHLWHSGQEIYRSLVGSFRYVSQDAEKGLLEKKAEYSKDEINLVVCLVSNDQAIGLIPVCEIDWIPRQGHLTGFLIDDPEHQGKGHGAKSLNLMLKHCIKDLGLNRIWSHILIENEISLKVFKKCGFQVEGHLKQQAFKDGYFRDVILVGLCAEDYFSLKEAK